jgi:hypothetical protein
MEFAATNIFHVAIQDFGNSRGSIILIIKLLNDWRMFFPLDIPAAACEIRSAGRGKAVGGQQHKFRG